MRILRLIAFSTLLASILSPSLDAGALRVVLLASAEVRSDTILLANLLPASVSPRLRAAARKIALGAAPQDGAAREFTRDALTSAISSAGLSPAEFGIPDFVTVRRGSRLVSRQEVFDAIQSARATNSVPGIPALRLQDITLEAAIRVPPGDARLQVTQIIFDPFLDRARIRFRARSAPGLLPFYAIVTVEAASSEPSPTGQKSVNVVAHVPGSNAISAPVLIAAGRLARLHIHSSDLNMLLEVRSLQRGRLGDVIRVRLPRTGRTLQARVTGDGSLDATL